MWANLLRLAVSTIAWTLRALIEAIARATLFGGAVGVHKLMAYFLSFQVPPTWGKVSKAVEFVDSIVFIAFIIIYLYLTYEVIAVFIPFLKTFKRFDNENGINETTNGSAVSDVVPAVNNLDSD